MASTYPIVPSHTPTFVKALQNIPKSKMPLDTPFVSFDGYGSRHVKKTKSPISRKKKIDCEII
jgi:hypothetical protein